LLAVRRMTLVVLVPMDPEPFPVGTEKPTVPVSASKPVLDCEAVDSRKRICPSVREVDHRRH